MTLNPIGLATRAVVRGLLLISVLAIASSGLSYGCSSSGLPVICDFVASPNPITVTDGTGLGVTTVSWVSIYAGTVSVYVTGKLFCAVPPQGIYNNGSCTTGKWVTNGTVFELYSGASPVSLTVYVNSSGGGGGGGGCSKKTCVAACQATGTACTGEASEQYNECTEGASSEEASCIQGCNHQAACISSCQSFYNQQMEACQNTQTQQDDACANALSACENSCNSCPNP